MHKRRRYVLNLDLENFFPSINFGRIRAVFSKDRNWALHEKVATVIAQIACDEGVLPQGSPCSPVISNIVTHILDVRLARLARQHKCTYSRYADDITFSTSQKEFPPQLAFQVPGTAHWQLGNPLSNSIERAGFRINPSKTRMQYRGSRQMATGLIVNEKVNIRAEYYRAARAMCNHLFTEGSYRRPEDETPITTLSQLDGILQHIYRVKVRADLRDSEDKKNKRRQIGKQDFQEEKQRSMAARTLYCRFLFYKHFIAPKRPLIIPEGKTDSIYLKCAIRYLAQFRPRLGEMQDGNFINALSFMNYSKTVGDVLRLRGGTGDLSLLIDDYRILENTYAHRPMKYPVIMLIDNDGGPKGKLFGKANSLSKTKITHESPEPFYHLKHNLYLVKTPSLLGQQQTCIEDFFPEDILKHKIDGKPFNPNHEHENHDTYSKQVFALQVVKPRAATIDFSGFVPLLKRIVAVLDDYDAKLVGADAAAAAD